MTYLLRTLFAAVLFVGTVFPVWAQTAQSLQQALENPDATDRLSLRHRQMDTLPSEISNCTALESLDLSHNRLKTLPVELGQLQHLKTLDLSHNPDLDIDQAMGVLSKLDSLEVLKLNNCDLMLLPESLGRMKRLQHLELNNNWLVMLPRSTGRLRKLQHLELRGNQLEALPRQIRTCKNLEYVAFGVSTDHQWENSIPLLSFSTELRYLELENLSTWPAFLSTLSELEELKLQLKSPLTVHKGWQHMEALQSLSIEGPLADDGKSLRYLARAPQLKQLALIETGWNQLPSEINRLKKLESLTLQSTALIKPELTVWAPKKLLALHLYGAASLDANAWFEDEKWLKKLDTLSMVRCGLQQYPEALNEARTLRFLNLGGNSMTALSQDFHALGALRRCVLYGNDMVGTMVDTLKNQMPDCQFLHDEILPFQASTSREVVISSQTTTKAKGIVPPVPGWEPSAETQKVDATTASLWVTASGTRLNIPANAFLDAEGNPVQGEVEMRYTEYSNPLAIALSGIPMTYDSGGVSNTFQSAGMMKFEARQNGQLLQPNPEALIQVDLLSQNASPTINLYELDSNSGRWTNVGKDEVTPASPPSTDDVVLLMPDKAPVRPQSPANPTYDQLNYRVSVRGRKMHIRIMKSGRVGTRKEKIHYPYPEFQACRNMTFTYEGDSLYPAIKTLRDFQGVYFDRKFTRKGKLGRKKKNPFSFWRGTAYREQGFQLKHTPETDNFELTLYTSNDTLLLPVFPGVRRSNHYQIQRELGSWHKRYTRSHDKGKKLRLEKSEKLEKQRKEFMEKMLVYREEFKNYRDTSKYFQAIAAGRNNLVNTAAPLPVATTISDPVYRSFALASFSVYNCDQIYRMAQPAPLVAQFVDTENQPFEWSEVAQAMVLDLTANAVFTYGTVNGVMYDQKSQIGLIMILKDNRVALARPEDCQGLLQYSSTTVQQVPFTIVPVEEMDYFTVYSMMGI